MPKPLCVLPFIHAYFDAQDFLAPCCAYNTHPANYQQVPVTEFDQWWHTGLDQLRSDMLAGHRHANCDRCWSEEARGLKSYRQHQNEKWKQYQDIQDPLPVPIFQMIAPGNFCNLKCIMCSPHLSSAWGVEYEKNKKAFESVGVTWHRYPRGFWSNRTQAYSVLSRTVPHAQNLHIMGGEPLLNPDCLRVLQQVPDPESVELIVSTNLTTLDPQWIELFQRFQTQVIVSVEGVGAKNDYIRAGSVWSDIDANIQQLANANINFHLSTAFGRPSLGSYPELADYAVSRGTALHTNMLSWPRFLSVESAPQAEREKFFLAMSQRNLSHIDTRPSPIQAYLDQIADMPYDAQLDQEFQQYIAVIDQIYSKNYQEIFHA